MQSRWYASGIGALIGGGLCFALYFWVLPRFYALTLSQWLVPVLFGMGAGALLADAYFQKIQQKKPHKNNHLTPPEEER